jgi:hypothetical protein
MKKRLVTILLAWLLSGCLALEALRYQATVTNLAQRHEVQPLA